MLILFNNLKNILIIGQKMHIYLYVGYDKFPVSRSEITLFSDPFGRGIFKYKLIISTLYNVPVQCTCTMVHTARGNEYFHISVIAKSFPLGKCPNMFKRIVKTTLPNPISLPDKPACPDVPVLSFEVDQDARYVRFVAYSAYVNSAALQYLHVDYDYPEGISNRTVACPGENGYDYIRDEQKSLRVESRLIYQH